MLKQKLQALFNPEQYHGWGKTKRYFEGWYYKIINSDETSAFAFIPGISMDENGKQQSFIQVLDGKKLISKYHKFGADEFKSKSGKFEISIQNNLFTKQRVELNLPTISGQLEFENQYLWPSKWYSPGIMGPYSFVPFMECYHGILSMDHSIHGKLSIHNKIIDFTNGRGYIEKDWGRSFPSAYFWMQTNHFNKQRVSLKASVAKIPWLGSSFVGFIAGILIDEKLIKFTTYNQTKLRKSFADKTKVELIMENSKYKLKLLAKRDKKTELASPIFGLMDGRIEESMTSTITVELYDKKKQTILFQDIGRNACIEVAGNIEEIIIS